MILRKIDASRYFETVFIYIFPTALIIFAKRCSIRCSKVFRVNYLGQSQVKRELLVVLVIDYLLVKEL